MVIDSLINKQDNFEIIRDQIASILALETANQMQLAINESLNPDDWKMRIYAERSNPWEQLLNDQVDKSPIINVWFENSNFDKSASNIVERQKAEGIFNIDCYGYGMSEATIDGHRPGDKQAALEAHRALRLTRNILMASEYTYLGLRGLVWQRWPQSCTAFQPPIDAREAQKILCVRLAMNVVFSEFSPQYTPQTLEYLSIDIKRELDGEIIAEVDFDYS